MFKPIGGALEKRIQKYRFQKTAQKDARTLLFGAMSGSIKEILKPEDIHYDSNKKDVTLVAHHRTIANEIALRLDEIYECTNKSGVSVARVLITVE